MEIVPIQVGWRVGRLQTVAGGKTDKGSRTEK